MRRPINPVIPYPNEAIQHTRCVLALSMITVALSLLKPETNAARDLAQFSARFGTPLTYKLSKLAHCMQRPGECLPAFAFTLRVWGMAVFSASDACAMTASKRGRTGTDGMRAGSPGLYFHAVCAHVLMKGGVPS